jgi:maleylacetate reductase
MAQRDGAGELKHYANRIARVIQNVDAREVLPAILAEERLASVLVLTSASFKTSSYLVSLLAAVPVPFVIFGECLPHSPAHCVIDAIATLGDLQPHAIVAIGGGSVIDTAKAVSMALWRGIKSPDRLSELRSQPTRVNSGEGEPGPRIIAIPTTLSAAELSPIGGMTNDVTLHKDVIGHEYAIPRSIIYDPRALLDAPRSILLGSGVKAIDHAAETLCAGSASGYAAPLAREALRLFARALPAIASAYEAGRQPALSDLAEAQLGCWMSMAGPAHGAPVGASHALGHALGAICGVAHGLTSCVTLAPVLRWNHDWCISAKREISEALDGHADERAETSLARLVGKLALPTRLSELGVTEAQLPLIAAYAFEDRNAATNCRPIASGQEMLEILRECL